MRSTGDSRKDEVRALQELNVKRREKAGKPTKAKKVDATVDGRGVYGQKSGGDSYKTGFGSWRSTKAKKAKPRPAKKRPPKYSSLAGSAGGPGSSNVPSTEQPRRHSLMDSISTIYDFGRGGIDELNQGNMMAPSVGTFAILDRFGVLEPNRTSDEYNAGAAGVQLAEMFSGPASLKLPQSGLRAFKAKRASEKAARETKNSIRRNLKESRRGRVNSSFKKWSEGSKEPKQPAPARRAVDAEDMPDLGPIDPRQPRPYAMGMLRPLEPDYLQGFHHMNVAAPSWYTPFRVFHGPRGGY